MSPRGCCLVMGLGLLVCGRTAGQTTERMSVATGGAQGNGLSQTTVISGDGRYVAFVSHASNLDPPPNLGYWDVLVHDRLTGTTERVAVNSAGGRGDETASGPSISADGRYIAFYSASTNLVPGDVNVLVDVFVRDRTAASTSLVSVDSSGGQGDASSFTSAGALSADGLHVAFWSSATTFAPGDTNGTDDIFVHDRQTGATICASVDSSGALSNSRSIRPAISGDGRFVAFESGGSNLVPGDTNGRQDIFVHDCQTGITTRASVDSSGAQADGGSWDACISADGRWVAFVSHSSNLVPGYGGGYGVYVHDLVTGGTSVVGVDSSGTGTPPADVYELPSISSDGRYVAYGADASVLVPGDTNGSADVFLRDRVLGTTTRVSVSSADVEGNAHSTVPSISGDGRYVAFESLATNLVAGDTNVVGDVFVRDRVPAAVTPFCLGDGSGTACPCRNNGGPNRGCENSATTGGGVLSATGRASLGSDSLRITSFGERKSALTVFIQGDTAIPPGSYGDGLRCLGGVLRLMFARNASLGVVTAPQGADPSISVRSAALGDPIPTGATRFYQVYYRDPALAFCPDPPGNTWNVSNAISVVWDP
jgi:Tol biopolymer transport system component